MNSERRHLIVAGLFVIAGSGCASADPSAPWKISAALFGLNSKIYTGTNAEVGLSYAAADKNLYSFDFTRTARHYDGGTSISDTLTEIGAVHIFGARDYLETHLLYSPDPLISPRAGVNLTPHHVLEGDFDVYTTLKLNRYEPGGNVATLSPGLIKSWDEINLGGQFNFVHSYHWIFAAQGYVQGMLNPQLSSRFTVAGGDTIDGPGIEDRFKSVALDVRWKWDARWSLIPNLSCYFGRARREGSGGLRVEASL